MPGENFFPPSFLGAGRVHVSGYLLRPLRSLDEVLAERLARERARRRGSDPDGAEGGVDSSLSD